MKMTHFIVEGFCNGDKSQDITLCKDSLKFGIYCFQCPNFNFASCPNEIAISNEEGIVEDWIGFGGDMEPAETEKRDEYIVLWSKICKEKIDEAYDEFIKKI